MTRGIDHLVLAVRDLDRARAAYKRLGFTMTPKAQHPFGTQNALVQLDTCFLEVLSVADPALFPAAEPKAFSFPKFNAHFLERREGMSMLVLDSEDAAADRSDFAEAGLQTYLPFEFGRDAEQPDATTARVGFKLAFTTDPNAPDAAYFTCEQLAPELFWKPDYQTHANTATTVREAMMISATPEAHWKFFEGFAGTDDVKETDTGLLVETGRGAIRIERPDGVAESWGTAVPVADYPSPRFAGTVIGVTDLDAAKACLEAGGIKHFDIEERLVVPSDETCGVAFAFEAKGD